MANMLSAMMSENKMGAIEKITFMFNQMVEMFTKNPAIVSVIFSEEIFKNEEVLKNKIVEILNKNEETVELIIKTGQKNNEIRKDINEKTLALMAMGSLRLLVKRWDLCNYKLDLKKEGKKLIEGLSKILS
jgi:flavorubredoxin